MTGLLLAAAESPLLLVSAVAMAEALVFTTAALRLDATSTVGWLPLMAALVIVIELTVLPPLLTGGARGV